MPMPPPPPHPLLFQYPKRTDVAWTIPASAPAPA
eukprot:CAMPEP_0184425758 /NCGR_PEP_ID=MMETSP0738-20130409/139127_1 /TAXON_ID=385413 /ORGANISM="Thalassiosira miniscula, Strain CCMP1093" /LENGTH=33 /DNA_ID= /DNA_START= /DNA_END= /DNA_ORIENTATION=